MRRTLLTLFAIGVSVTPLARAHAQQTQQVRPVSLEDAIRLADRSSEVVDIARAAVARATGQQAIARSQGLPQLNFLGSYAKTLASQFEDFSFGGGPDTNTFRSLCTPNIPPSATPAERQAALDQSRTCQAAGGGADFSSVGFGAKNQWILGLEFYQPVYTGGKVSGQRSAATASRRAADIELTAQRAQLILDVTQAYYNTVLASRLVEIAETSLAMNEEVLRQTTRARQVGSSSEFDLLRAKVARDNQIPVVFQRRGDRDVASYRLKQLIEVPLSDSLQLTTSIDEAPMPILSAVVDTARGSTPDTTVASRATVREAAENITAQKGLLRAAKAERLPTVAIVSGYQRLFFPIDVQPNFTDFRENWTVGANVSVNLFSGGRVTGGVRVAEANLREAQARHKQAREFAALDARIALSQLEQAEATWRASQGTAEQAKQAYSIDQIRYREGISTQTDLTQSQLLVQQAMVNRAVAARDLAVARMRLVLLKDLPLNAPPGGAGINPTGTGNFLTVPVPQPPLQRPGGTTASTSGSNQ